MLSVGNETALVFAWPWALLLVPPLVVVWLWLRHWPRVVRVGSTFVWQRVTVRRHHPRGPWTWLLLAILLTIAAARPGFIPTVEAPKAPLFRVTAAPHPGAPPRAEIIFEAQPTETNVQILASSTVLVEDRIGASEEATARSWVLPPSAAGTLNATIRCGGETRRMKAQAPSPWVPVPVVNDTTSELVSRALDALEQSQWIQYGRKTQFVRISRTDIRAPEARMSIVIPESSGSVPLPVPEPASDHDPLLEGLHPRQWTIGSAHPMTDDQSRRFPTVILDSDTGPLIARGEAGFLFCFDPRDSSLAEGAAWPILLGRLIQSAVPPRTAPAVPRWPSRLPQWSLLVLAGVLLLMRPDLIASRAARLAVVVLVIGAGLIPSFEAGTPWRTKLTGIHDAVGPALGTDVFVAPDSLALPLEEGRLVSVLRARGIGLEIESTQPRLLQVTPTHLDLGSSVTLKVDLQGGARQGLAAVAPDGTRTALSIPEGGTVSHTPDSGGHWYYQLLDADGSLVASPSVRVLDRVQVLLASTGPGAGAGALVQDSSFQVVNWNGTESISTRLPRLSDGTPTGVVLWDNVDPAVLSDTELQDLKNWLQGGGVWFGAAAPPFHPESTQKTLLSEQLPAALPEEPRQQEIALGIILLDLSGSMASGESLAIVSSATVALLDATPRGGRWGVARFRDQPAWIAPPGSPVSRQLIEAAAALDAGGGTRLDRALDFVLDEFESVEAGRTLVILTDGRVDGQGQWDTYRARLEEADVELWVVTVGQQADDRILTQILPQSGGGRVHLGSTRNAAEKLSDAIRKPAGPWRSLRGEIRRLGRSPLLSAVPSRLPSLKRWLLVTPHSEAERLLMTASGTPLLLERPIGRGRTVLWASGFDRASLPSDYAGTRIVSALSSVLIAATRVDARPQQRAEIRSSIDGGDWITLERSDDSAQIAASTESAGLQTASRTFLPWSENHWAVEAPQPSFAPRWIRVGSESHGVEIDPYERAQSLQQMASRVPTRTRARWDVSGCLLLLALAALVAQRVTRREGP